MNWFKRKKRTFGNQEIPASPAGGRNWDIGVSGDQGPDRISGYPGTRVSGTRHLAGAPGTGRSKRLTSYLLPLTSALFTAFLMIHTAVVLSDPAFPFIQASWSGGAPADSTACTSAGGTWNSGTSECFANLTGYTGYSVKPASIDVSAGDIRLQSTDYTATDDGTLTTTGTATGGTFAAGTSTATNTAVSGNGIGASVWLEIFLTKTLDKRDNFIHKAWYSRVSFWLTAMS